MDNNSRYPCPVCGSLEIESYEEDYFCSVCECENIEWQRSHLSEKGGVFEAEKKAWRIGENIFWVNEMYKDEIYKLEEEHYPNWRKVKKIVVGELNDGVQPEKCYLVSKDYMPYLLVEVYYDYRPIFPGYTLWNDFLLIGRNTDFYYIYLLTFQSAIFSFQEREKSLGYFGHFYQYGGYLLVASCGCLYCFDEKCALVWQTEEIACDGVLVHGYEDGYLRVAGENDPPGGWIEHKIDFATGRVVERKWALTDNYTGLFSGAENPPEDTLRYYGMIKKWYDK